jgi:hypothetical protein
VGINIVDAVDGDGDGNDGDADADEGSGGDGGGGDGSDIAAVGAVFDTYVLECLGGADELRPLLVAAAII